VKVTGVVYRGTPLMIISAPLGPYSGNMPQALRWPYEGGVFLLSEVPLCGCAQAKNRAGLWIVSNPPLPHAQTTIRWVDAGPRSFEGCRGLQGYLGHEKTPPPGTLQ